MYAPKILVLTRWELIMRLFFRFSQYTAAIAAAFLCATLSLCNSKGPTQSNGDLVPTTTKIDEMKISAADVPGWAASAINQDTFCEYPGDSLYCCAPGSIDGGAVPYDSIGCVQVAFQSLTGPDPMLYSSHSMDFATSAKAKTMFDYIKRRLPSQVALSGFDTAVAVAGVGMQAVQVLAHFNKYYFELAFVGVVDTPACLQSAVRFLTVFKNRIK